MFNCFIEQETKTNATPITAVAVKEWDKWLSKQTSFIKSWVDASKFSAKTNNILLIPDEKGELNQAILIFEDENDFWSFGVLNPGLPKGIYYFNNLKKNDYYRATLAWGLGAYQFTRYKRSTRPSVQLIIDSSVNKQQLMAQLSAIYQVRDLINTPTDDMGPAELAAAIVKVGAQFGASVTQIIGIDLLKANYHAIHAVGRASRHEPRLIDLTWGNPNHPKVTLVGKGVCFDSGGLNIKTAPGMLWMKKDMGGAANALGLAEMIMAFNIPVRLRLLIPAVENLIAGNAYKPGDVITMRNGMNVEIGNTDAEGRLIIGDALVEADSENPDLLMDFSTLTGAARSAVGTEISAFFTDKDELANKIVQHSIEVQDPLWRLPLYKPYAKYLDSKIADINNAASTSYAGAITAALFLRAFVKEKTCWVHFDFNAYNINSRPGRPEGGEAMAIFTLINYLVEKYKS